MSNNLAEDPRGLVGQEEEMVDGNECGHMTEQQGFKQAIQKLDSEYKIVQNRLTRAGSLQYHAAASSVFRRFTLQFR